MFGGYFPFSLFVVIRRYGVNFKLLFLNNQCGFDRIMASTDERSLIFIDVLENRVNVCKISKVDRLMDSTLED